MRPRFLINAASYEAAGRRRAREAEREKMLAANAILPQMIARVCLMTKTPWGHVSSGSVYCGAKVEEEGRAEVRLRLDEAETVDLFGAHPERFQGFTERDEPNFSFRTAPCDFYSGTKALAEEAVREIGQSYIWRFWMPFNARTEPCNWLWRMQRRGHAQEAINSFSHLEDCVKACLDLWEMKAPPGTYNVTNPGAMTTGQVALEMQRHLRTRVRVEAGSEPDDPDAPRPNCILDSSKLLRAGVKLRPVQEALTDSLERLRLAAPEAEPLDAVEYDRVEVTL
jgi:dTDP-4-dehydrorhamnose reductase